MASFSKLNGFVEHLAEGVHNLGSDSLVLALTNTAPSGESNDPSAATSNCVKAELTEVSYTNLSSRAVTVSASAQTSGTYQLTCADVTLTATGGSVGPFQYVYLVNDTPTSPADPLVGYWDYGSALTLATGESLTVDFDGTSGVLQIA